MRRLSRSNSANPTKFRPTLFIGLSAGLILLIACGPDKAALPKGPQRISVSMTEYRFSYAENLRAGRVFFVISNKGLLVHHMSLSALPDDFPPLSEQLKGAVRRSIVPLAAIPDLPPGDAATLAVDLRPGRYGLLCFVVDGDHVSHAVKGMVSEFRVR